MATSFFYFTIRVYFFIMHNSNLSFEKKLPRDMSGIRLFFTGIKGTGMTALVEICHERGAIIDGSDIDDVFYTDAILSSLDIRPKLFSKNNITENIDLVFHSSAYDPESHEELLEAKALGIPIMEYTIALGEISKASFSVAVSGVHGKTSTTSIIGTILKELPLESQVLVGSQVPSFGNSCTMHKGSEFFIAETCEYKKHFLHFHPSIILMTSVEEDHQDFFPHYEDMRDAFVEFVSLLPENGRLIYCADDKGSRDVVSIVKEKRKDIRYIAYGKNAKDAGETYFYSFTNLYLESGTQNFTVQTPDFEKKLSLRVPGYHSVLNSLGAIAVCLSLWEEKGNSLNEAILDSIGKALLQFVGAKRRSEIVADIPQSPSNPYGALIIDDYAHHPTAIETTLKGFRDFYPDRLLIVSFMSHTYSRTHALLDAFSKAFSSADIVILHKIYSSARENKEKYIGNTSGEILFQKTSAHHPQVLYFDEFLDAQDEVLHLMQNKASVFITMGAGDNWKLGLAVKNRLEDTK